LLYAWGRVKSHLKLHVTQYGNNRDDSQSPLIILHGLFGSHQNWHSIAKSLSEQSQVYSLDLRNHGKSPHTDNMDYPSMARDIADFMQQHSLSSVRIIAHSMGGKVALWLALTRPELIEKLVVVDIAPVSYAHSFEDVLAGFDAVPLASIHSRQDADIHMAKIIKEHSLRQFLLQNLQWQGESFQWRLNLSTIRRSIAELTTFPESHFVQPFAKRVLFVGGLQSDYLNKTNQQQARQLFPKATFSMIKSAGHWLHVEQPELFKMIIEPYLSDK